MKYSRILAEFYSKVWAIREETLLEMQNLLRQQSAGVKWSVEEIRERIEASNLATGFVEHENTEARFLAFDDEPMPMRAAGKRSARPGSVAVIPMTGIISHRVSMMSQVSGGGGLSIQGLTAQFRQALEDGNCKAIVFDVDSPGGSVEGVMELAQEIYDARKVKPVTAVCNAMACSAAYWLASAAGEVECTPSGQCGSIGVYMLLQDESEALKQEGIKINILKAGKYKAEGHPSQPLSDNAREFLQGQVESVYSLFVKAVATQRGVSLGAVRAGMGQGRSLLANDAVKANLADRTGTLDDVLEKYGVKTGRGARGMASARGARVLENRTEPEDYKRAIARRRRQFSLSAAAGTALPEDDDEDEPPCGCPCQACENCIGDPGTKADGDMGCTCACSACKACENRGTQSSQRHCRDWVSAIARRRHELEQMR
jgi:signal peptide peptidase SppA